MRAPPRSRSSAPADRIAATYSVVAVLWIAAGPPMSARSNASKSARRRQAPCFDHRAWTIGDAAGPVALSSSSSMAEYTACMDVVKRRYRCRSPMVAAVPKPNTFMSWPSLSVLSSCLASEFGTLFAAQPFMMLADSVSSDLLAICPSRFVSVPMRIHSNPWLTSREHARRSWWTRLATARTSGATRSAEARRARDRRLLRKRTCCVTLPSVCVRGHRRHRTQL